MARALKRYERILNTSILSNEIVVSSSDTLDADECSGTLINNYGQTDDMVITLPVASEGMGFTIVLGTTVAKYVRIDPNASDKIYLDGVADSDGHYVGIASAVAGATIQFKAFQVGEGAYDWYANVVSGAWVME